MLKRRLTLTLTVLVVAVLLASYPAVPVGADYNIKTIGSCMTIDKPWSYTVDKNIEAGRGNCLVITTSNVTIDLAGYTISGDLGLGSAGIRTVGALEAITVRNGSVTGFDFGILLLGRHHVVEQVRLTHNASAGIDFGLTDPTLGPGARGNTVRNSIASGNFGNGILLPGRGHSVIGNVAQGNGFTGIFLGCPSVVVNNVATDNGTVDIGIASGIGCTRHANYPPSLIDAVP